MVAGAAEGLGAEFSRLLASNGKNLILVDRNEDQLNMLVTSIQQTSRVEVRTTLLDLTQKHALETISEQLKFTKCSLVVYNAAYGPVKKFLENNEEELDYYIDLNARIPLILAHRFASLRINQGPAGFLMMSSLAGLRGTMLVAPYAATKAFDWNLMEGLFYEFKNTNIDFTACCAGPIATPGYISTKPGSARFKPKDAHPADVAREALSALGESAIWIEGQGNRWSDFLMRRILPHSWASVMANKTMKEIFKAQWGSGYDKI